MMLHHLYHRSTLEFNNQPRCETWKYFHQRKKRNKLDSKVQLVGGPHGFYT